jgi:hypothetical protein
MLASRAMLRPLSASARGLATKVAVGGAGGALGSAVLAKIAAGGLGLGDVELKVMGADKLPPASGSVKSISGAPNVSGLLGDANYAILLSGEPAQFQAAGKALAPGAIAGVVGNTNALIVATAAGEGKVVTGITMHKQAEGEATLASHVRRAPLHPGGRGARGFCCPMGARRVLVVLCRRGKGGGGPRWGTAAKVLKHRCCGADVQPHVARLACAARVSSPSSPFTSLSIFPSDHFFSSPPLPGTHYAPFPPQGSSVAHVITWGESVVDLSHATVDGKWALPLAGSALPSATPASPDATATAIVAHMKVRD